MSKLDFIIDVLDPAEDNQLNIEDMEQECSDLISANHIARNCFLIKVLVEERAIICKVLLGFADFQYGHSNLNNSHWLPRYISAGGGMLWTTKRILHIGSFSVSYNSVHKKILELIGEQIGEKVRSFGVEFDDIDICPYGDINNIWFMEPFNQMIV